MPNRRGRAQVARGRQRPPRRGRAVIWVAPRMRERVARGVRLAGLAALVVVVVVMFLFAAQLPLWVVLAWDFGLLTVVAVVIAVVMFGGRP